MESGITVTQLMIWLVNTKLITSFIEQ